MLRFCLALLLSLSLWPSAAGASTDAPVRGQRDRILAPTASYAQEVARSTGGLELLRGLENRAPDGSTRAPLHHFQPSRRGTLVAHPAAPVSIADVPPTDACAPLCERLPYDATAPPALR